jgi:hypothetical protein
VRLTEFWARMEHVLGPSYARSWAADQVLRELDGRSVEQALADGEQTARVWRAVCESLNLPAHQR